MIAHIILLIIETIALFFQAFYFGRRQLSKVKILSLVLIFSPIVGIVLDGMYSSSGAILDINIYELIVAFIYCVFWWGLGYLLSFFVLIKETDIGKMRLVRVER